ncbi:uncharacterized protein LOC119390670 isoform X5 [Rhipicephalus sanguineus]|uniref:uncharacterized protein LOC119390670 isoform X5 n=1 Tax=Rhipicephalus sanguineus TaxID=34632 RepID=UPI0020C32FAE|nr:uncharacterized protein LOC119390670 isoform X5 [Rhipicephalus sanguineus]
MNGGNRRQREQHSRGGENMRFLDSCSLEMQPSGTRQDQVNVAKEIMLLVFCVLGAVFFISVCTRPASFLPAVHLCDPGQVYYGQTPSETHGRAPLTVPVVSSCIH